MRCPNCNKFVSYDEPEAQVDSVELNGGTLSANVRLVLNCSECGGELKDAELEAHKEIEHECDACDLEIADEGTPDTFSRLQDKDRRGKTIKSSRYMKTFYGFSLECSINCTKCGESIEAQLDGEEQASGFNELV